MSFLNPDTRKSFSNQNKGKDSNDKSPSMFDKDNDSEKSPDIMWLNYETRLRKLMQELLQPTIKRSREDRELYDMLKHKCDTLTKRVEELETITHKAETKQTIFDDIFNKINKIDTARKSDYADLIERMKNIEEQAATITFDYNHLRDGLKSMNDLTQKVSEDFTKTTLQLDEYKKSFADIIKNLQKDINDEAKARRNDYLKVEEKFQLTNNNVLDLKNNMNSNEIVMETTRNSLNELINKINRFEKEVEDSNRNIASFSKHIDSIKTVQTKAEQLDLQTRTSENYLEKYLPIFVQAQISETLHHCLPTTNKKKLYVYEEKKFKDLNAEILHDDGNPDLQKRIQSMYVLLETTVKRYGKSMAASSLGIRARESEMKHTDSSMSRLTKAHKNSILGAGLSDRMKNNVSEDIVSEGTGRVGVLPSSLNEKVDEVEVPLSSRHISVILEGEETRKNKDISDQEKDRVSSLAKMIDNKGLESQDKIIVENQTLEQAGDEASEAGSDLDYIQSKQIRRLQDEVALLKVNNDNTLRKFCQDVNERLERMGQEQLEIAENATLNVRSVMIDLDKFMNERKKETMTKCMELEGYVENLTKSNEKSYYFQKKLSEIVVALIDTVNGLLIITLKEESQRVAVQSNANQTSLNETQKRKIIPLSGESDDIHKRKRESFDPKKVDFPPLVGTKYSQPGEENRDNPESENGINSLKTMEFLKAVSENFRACVLFGNKYKVANFAQFYDGESSKILAEPRKSLRSAKGGPHLIYDEKVSEKAISLGLKAPLSKIMNTSYKNYVSEHPNGRILDRKKNPTGLLKDNEGNINKSFH